ncbi:MAG TPA: protease inhibitor I42 family protein [Anaerolineae bacterium]|nr:protease inhibitor I42 family protein [Anaerolineae bacterium]
MKMLVLGSAFAVLALAACSSSTPPVMIGEGDNNSTQAVSVGQELQVTLPSNPTTGYSWNLTQNPDPQILLAIGSHYNAPAQQIPGKGGTETWSFRGTRAGTTSFTLVYLRPFAPADNPSPPYTINVNVK